MDTKRETETETERHRRTERQGDRDIEANRDKDIQRHRRTDAPTHRYTAERSVTPEVVTQEHTKTIIMSCETGLSVPVCPR